MLQVGFASTVLARATIVQGLALMSILERIGEEDAHQGLEARDADGSHLRRHDPLKLAAPDDLAVLHRRREQAGVSQELREEVYGRVHAHTVGLARQPLHRPIVMAQRGLLG